MEVKEKVWLIIASALGLCGWMAFVSLMSINGWDFSNVSTEKMVNQANKAAAVSIISKKIEKVLADNGLVSVGNQLIADNPELVKAMDGYEKQKATTAAKRKNKAKVCN